MADTLTSSPHKAPSYVIVFHAKQHTYQKLSGFQKTDQARAESILEKMEDQFKEMLLFLRVGSFVVNDEGSEEQAEWKPIIEEFPSPVLMDQIQASRIAPSFGRDNCHGFLLGLCPYNYQKIKIMRRILRKLDGNLNLSPWPDPSKEVEDGSEDRRMVISYDMPQALNDDQANCLRSLVNAVNNLRNNKRGEGFFNMYVRVWDRLQVLQAIPESHEYVDLMKEAPNWQK